MRKTHFWKEGNYREIWGCVPLLTRFVVLRCRCSQSQQQGRTTARALRSQSSTPPFSKAPIRPRLCRPPQLPPHRYTLQPTASTLVVQMTYIGKRSTVYKSVYVLTYTPDLWGNTLSNQFLGALSERSNISFQRWQLHSHISYTNDMAKKQEACL